MSEAVQKSFARGNVYFEENHSVILDHIKRSNAMFITDADYFYSVLNDKMNVDNECLNYDLFVLSTVDVMWTAFAMSPFIDKEIVQKLNFQIEHRYEACV